MSTLTAEQQEKIRCFLNDRHIVAGLGNEEEACSIAAINLALTGRLTDEIPSCMSEVIGKWIIGVQDSMPDELRNSDEWRELLPLAAGSGRQYERERAAIILDWMWSTALPQLQPLADSFGFGKEWLAMTTEKTGQAAMAAWEAAWEEEGEAARAAYWNAVDPVSVLRRLIEVGDQYFTRKYTRKAKQ